MYLSNGQAAGTTGGFHFLCEPLGVNWDRMPEPRIIISASRIGDQITERPRFTTSDYWIGHRSFTSRRRRAWHPTGRPVRRCRAVWHCPPASGSWLHFWLQELPRTYGFKDRLTHP
jgi:hypothetical protein